MENKIHGYVYLITNLINGKQYVGQTARTIKIRSGEHISDSKHGKNYINRAIKKYGIENFKIEQIDIAYNQEELNLIEGIYILLFNTLRPNGYNLKEIIDGKGKHSEETKEKLRKIANTPKRLKIQSENGKKRRGKSLGGSSKYCGVYTKQNRYMSKICFNNKQFHIGYYMTEEEAAKAYDIAAIKYFGHDAILNFPELREKYLNNEIAVNKTSKQDVSKSGIKGIYLNRNKWMVKWLNKHTNKYKEKYFKTLEEAKLFKNLNLPN